MIVEDVRKIGPMFCKTWLQIHLISKAKHQNENIKNSFTTLFTNLSCTSCSNTVFVVVFIPSVCFSPTSQPFFVDSDGAIVLAILTQPHSGQFLCTFLLPRRLVYYSLYTISINKIKCYFEISVWFLIEKKKTIIQCSSLNLSSYNIFLLCILGLIQGKVLTTMLQDFVLTAHSGGMELKPRELISFPSHLSVSCAGVEVGVVDTRRKLTNFLGW